MHGINKVWTLNCKGRLFSLEQPQVMGILNLTPDSFFDGGKFIQESEIQRVVEKMLEDGAGIVDIGGVSTRPGAAAISVEDEWRRIGSAFNLLRNRFPDTFFSIDTTSSEIARRCIDSGADIINDVSGGDADPAMFELIAASKTPYILMHMQGNPVNMQVNPHYHNVVKEVLLELIDKANRLRAMGVIDIVIDPGFGFGKTTEHNYRLLEHLQLFAESGYPVLAGFSRKSMINRVLEIKPNEALNGTTVLNTIALLKGASILRVHDVKEAVQAVKLVAELNS